MTKRIWGLALGTALAAGVVSGCKGGSTPSGPGPLPPTPSPSPTAAPTLSGAWVGLVSEGMGLTVLIPNDGVTCTIKYDVDVTLTQSGNSLSGPTTIINRINCPERGYGPIPDVVRPTFSATLSPPDAIEVRNLDEFDQIPLRGAYSATLIDATAHGPHRNSDPRTYTLRLRKK